MGKTAADYRTRIEQMQSFGNVSGSESRKLLFRFKEPNEYLDVPTSEMRGEIEDVIKDCSCSTPVITDAGIEVTYTNSVAISDEQLKEYPDGRMPHETTVTLYMRDGKPLKKLDEKTGQMRYNKEKAKVMLFLYGTIVRKL